MREEVKFDIGDKAEELLFSVFDLTTSRQHYPVKFRRLADQLQTYALNIHSNVMDANSFRTDSSSQRQKRFDFQTSAVTNCTRLVLSGRMTREKFNEKYNSWKNHASHGNCYKLTIDMDRFVEGLFSGAST